MEQGEGIHHIRDVVTGRGWAREIRLDARKCVRELRLALRGTCLLMLEEGCRAAFGYLKGAVRLDDRKCGRGWEIFGR